MYASCGLGRKSSAQRRSGWTRRHSRCYFFALCLCSSANEVFAESVDRIEQLRRWLQGHNGSFIHPQLEVRQVGRSGSRGIFVGSDIAPGERLLEIPWSAILSAQTALNGVLPSGLIRAIAEVTAGTSADPHLWALALQVLQAKRADDEVVREFSSFIETCPDENWSSGQAQGDVGPVKWWTEGPNVEGCLAVLGPLQAALRQDREQLRRLQSRVSSVWKHATGGKAAPSFRQLSWALAVASTRSFGVDWSTVRLSQNFMPRGQDARRSLKEDDAAAIVSRFGGAPAPVMVPFADLINHAVPPSAKFEFVVGRGLVVTSLEADEDGSEAERGGLANGQEVTLSYGLVDNNHLYKTYGFVMMGNPVGAQLAIPLGSSVSEDATCSLEDLGGCASPGSSGSRPNSELQPSSQDTTQWLYGPKMGGELPDKVLFDGLLAGLRGSEANVSDEETWTLKDTELFRSWMLEHAQALEAAMQSAPGMCVAYAKETLRHLRGTLTTFADHLLMILDPGSATANAEASSLATDEEMTWRALLRVWLLRFGKTALSSKAMAEARSIDAPTSSMVADVFLRRSKLEGQYKKWTGVSR
eukprot:TRINITY_DN80493_c0_g1_i1.p1 TRINITY_DN80493_c0_g1~~TRINITY_DN80493_c0_g1_i1.p1  ORF type:complete len:586 (-),score=101.60 TRINITY_DN80493_c0_g1_i1:168-1925(-)